MARVLVVLATLLTAVWAQNERWFYRYNGAGNQRDWAGSVAVGADSNIYAAGTAWNAYVDFMFASFRPDGTVRWLNPVSAGGYDEIAALVVGLDGNLYAAGNSVREYSKEFRVLSLRPDGVVRWHYYLRLQNWDCAYSLAVGPDSNLYAAGGRYKDFVVVSLNQEGAERWVYRYHGSVPGYDIAYAVAVGPDSNVYAAGESGGSGGGDRDLVVVSLSPDSAERWVYRYNGPGNGTDEAFSLAFDTAGNVYAAGYSSDSVTGHDLTVVSLDQDGGERWVYRYDGPGGGGDWATSVAACPDGDVCAAGYSTGVGTGWDFTVVRLSPEGAARWVYRYDGPGGVGDFAHSLAIGPDGYIFVAGHSIGVGTGHDFTVVGLSPEGVERWVYRFSQPVDEADEARSLAIGPEGNIYAAGYVAGYGTGLDFAVVSLSPDVGLSNPGLHSTEVQPGIGASTIAKRGLDLTLRLPEPASVRLSLWDLQGRRLDAWEVAVPRGASQHFRSLAQLPAGVYVLSADAPAVVFHSSRKCIKLDD